MNKIISSKFSRTEQKLQILTGIDSTKMKSIDLLPLVINNKQPAYIGSVFNLIEIVYCYQNTCLGNPCILKDAINSPCCLKYLLNKNSECPLVDSRSKQYLAKLKENEFLLVSAKFIDIYSSTCPNIKANVQGSFIIVIDVDEMGCNLFLDNLELPIKGAISIHK